MTENKSFSMRLAVPSKGELERPTLDFLSAAGLRVNRPNERQYVASIPALPALQVLFQRVPDILVKVEEGSVDLGITGYDVLREQGEETANTVILYENLGFGQCELALAVPESWVDVSNIEDLAELTLLYKEKGQVIRIATKYPNLTKVAARPEHLLFRTGGGSRSPGSRPQHRLRRHDRRHHLHWHHAARKPPQEVERWHHPQGTSLPDRQPAGAAG